MESGPALPNIIPAIQRYLKIHARIPGGDEDLPAPRPGLKLVVVIPSLAEREGLGEVLSSLEAGSLRLDEAEAIVVVNNPAQPDARVLENNLETLRDLRRRPAGKLPVHALDRASPGRWLPADKAGVGLARRLGMDLALARLLRAGGAERGAIACLDGDSPAGPGYADAWLSEFDRNDPPLGGLCGYEHPLPDDPRRARPIVIYELWLRYIEAGMRFTGSPFAFSAVGSCTAASAYGYALADGMPERKAAEDFHFLRKLAKASGFKPLAAVRSLTVYPSARASDRVPFGTGRAMGRSPAEQEARYARVEPPGVFFELRKLFLSWREGYARPDALPAAAGPRLDAFLAAEGAWAVMDKLRAIYPSARHFELACQHWFDGLRIVRFANQYAREAGRVEVLSAWRELLAAWPEFTAAAGPPPAGKDGELELEREWLRYLRSGTRAGALEKAGTDGARDRRLFD